MARISNSKAALAITKEQDKWRVESDLDTLKRAEEIEKDPKRMAAVQALAKQQLLAIASIVNEKD